MDTSAIIKLNLIKQNKLTIFYIIYHSNARIYNVEILKYYDNRKLIFNFIDRIA